MIKEIARSYGVLLTLESMNDGWTYVLNVLGDVIKTFSCDTSGGWETMRYSYAQAARAYNEYVPSFDAIPLF